MNEIKLKNATQQGYLVGVPGDGVVLNYIDRARGRVQKGRCPTLSCAGGGDSGVITMKDDEVTIRKLTERECMRLMGYIDEEIEPLLNEFSKTAVYKFAGNSVVVDCFTAITNEILKDMDGKNVTLEGWLE